jgi:hypothetical protein
MGFIIWRGKTRQILPPSHTYGLRGKKLGYKILKITLLSKII